MIKQFYSISNLVLHPVLLLQCLPAFRKRRVIATQLLLQLRALRQKLFKSSGRADDKQPPAGGPFIPVRMPHSFGPEHESSGRRLDSALADLKCELAFDHV